jgi:hypothetical protein
MATDPNARYAIIPIPPGPPPPNALMIGGPLSQVMQCIPDTIARRNSIRSLQAARLDAAVITQAQKATRALQVQSFCDGVNQISARLDAVEKRRARKLRQIAAQQKADDEKQIADYLNTLPDPDNPPASYVYFNTGDLSTPLPPTNSDNEGDLPKNLLQTTPPTPGIYPSSDPSELGYPEQSKYRQMPAISLASEDDY